MTQVAKTAYAEARRIWRREKYLFSLHNEDSSDLMTMTDAYFKRQTLLKNLCAQYGHEIGAAVAQCASGGSLSSNSVRGNERLKNRIQRRRIEETANQRTEFDNKRFGEWLQKSI
jgi:hypothetical protein